MKTNRSRRNPRLRLTSFQTPSRYPAIAVARQPQMELKQTVASAGGGPIFDGAGVTISDMTSQITQGVADNQRIGDHLYLRSIEVHVMTSNGVGATANIFTNWRFVVFQWLSDSNTAPTIGNVFLTSNMNFGNTQGTWSFYDIDHADQVIVLFDSGPKMTVGSNQVAVTGDPGNFQQNRGHRFKVPLGSCDRNVRYYAAGVQGPNHIYLLITTDQQTTATNPQASYGYKIRFTDS